MGEKKKERKKYNNRSWGEIEEKEKERNRKEVER